MLHRSGVLAKWRPIDAWVRGKGKPRTEHRRSIFGNRGRRHKWMKHHGLRDAAPTSCDSAHGVRVGGGGLFGRRYQPSAEFLELAEEDKDFLAHGTPNIANRTQGISPHPDAVDIGAPVPISFSVALMLNVGPARAQAARRRAADAATELVLSQLMGGGDDAVDDLPFALDALHVYGRHCRVDIDIPRLDSALAGGAISVPSPDEAARMEGLVIDGDEPSDAGQGDLALALRVAVESVGLRDQEVRDLLRGKADEAVGDTTFAEFTSEAHRRLSLVAGPQGTLGAAAIQLVEQRDGGALAWADTQRGHATMLTMAAPLRLRADDGSRRPSQVNVATTRDWVRHWWRANEPSRHVCAVAEHQRRAMGTKARAGTAHRVKGVMLVPVDDVSADLAAALKRRRISQLAESAGDAMKEISDFALRRLVQQAPAAVSGQESAHVHGEHCQHAH